MDFLYEDENIQDYLNEQNAVPCKAGDFALAPMLDGMKDFITEGNVTDYQDHYYPSEMAVDAQLQSYLIEKNGMPSWRNLIRIGSDITATLSVSWQNTKQNRAQISKGDTNYEK